MPSQNPDAPNVSIPTPSYSGGVGSLVLWGSRPYAGASSSGTLAVGGPRASLKDLVGYGDSAPAPLALNGIERCALAYFGGFIQLDDGNVVNMDHVSKDLDGRWIWGSAGGKDAEGHWKNGGVAACWACDPSSWKPITITGGSSGIGSVKFNHWAYGQLGAQYPETGVDEAVNGNATTAINLFAWGNAVSPAMRLSAVEMRALLQTGDDAGWCKVAGHSGIGIIDLNDARYSKQGDGTWINRNHPEQGLGVVTDVASKPKNGIAGFVDAVFHDVEADPLGALLFVVVAISAGPALAAFLDPLLTGAAVAAAVTTPGTVAQAAVDLAEHPAEIGRVVGGAELAIAAGAVGLKGLGGAIQKGVTGGGNFGQNDSQIPSNVPPAGLGTGSSGTSGSGKKWWQILGGA